MPPRDFSSGGQGTVRNSRRDSALLPCRRSPVLSLRVVAFAARSSLSWPDALPQGGQNPDAEVTMAHSKTDFEVLTSPADFRKVVVDVEQFPEFLDEMKEVEVLERSDDAMLARFVAEANVAGMKVQSTYTLRYDLSGKNVSWTLESSPNLTANSGTWHIEAGDDDDECRVTYELELSSNLPIPEEFQAMFTEQIVKDMAEAVRNRAEELFG